MSNFLQAARHTNPSSPLPHQDAAWQWAWEQLTKEQQTEFLEMFRAAVPTKQDDGPISWQGVATMAREAGARFPELVAAQWALESGWGKHTSGKNNFFGLKGSGTTVGTTEYVNGQKVSIKDSFIDFPSARACISYLVERWYKDFQRYKGVNNAANREDAARMLQKEGYATDPRYAEKLIDLMRNNAPPTPSVTPIPSSTKPSPIVIPNAIGPKKVPQDFGFKRGDSHIIVDDISERARAFNFDGQLLWDVPALARGQGNDREYRFTNTDTPPGLYSIGQIYRDYEQVGASPAFTSDLRAYGWYSFDLIDLEGQESKHGRAGIMIHGGGSACGWPGAWAPMQKLFPTHGCVRMHNQHLRDKLLPLTHAGKVFVSVYQEK